MRARRFIGLGIGLLTLSLVAVQAPEVWAVLGGRSSGGGPVSNSGHILKQSVVVGDNLQGWYPFDGNVNDISGNTRTGTPNNVTAAAGKIGQAYNFNGVDSYVRTPSYAFSGTAITISAWVNTSQQNYNQTLFASGTQSNTAAFIFNYRAINTDTFVYQYTNGTLAKSLIVPNFFTGYNGVWLHITVVADYTAGTVDFYRNATLFTTLTAAPGDTMQFPSLNQAKYIGTYFPSLHPFGGLIDDFRVYTTALSAADIAKIYKGSPPAPCDQTCVGWWKLDEASGTSAADSSNTGNTGTMINGPVPAAGLFGNGYFFDGINDYIQAGAASPVSSSNASFAAWVYPTSSSATSYVIDSRTTPNRFTLIWYPANGTYKGFAAHFGTGSAWAVSPAVAATNAWYHVAATNDGITTKLYVNGALLSSAATDPASSITTGWMIGANASGTNWFPGTIDDVRLYNRALTDYEVAEQYLAGRP